MKRFRTIGLLSVGLLLLGACSGGSDAGEGGQVSLGNQAISIADAKLTITADRDVVTVNGTALGNGNFQDAKPGDEVVVDQSGSARVMADSVFEIEGLRNAQLTVPDLTQAQLVSNLTAGHVFVRLNPAADATVVIDTGERQFATRSPDAEFGLCQAPDGASCLAVIKGSVEWIEDGIAAEVYTAGQATFAGRGKAPEPTRCADAANVSAMQRSLRGLDFAGALADIVSTWDTCDTTDTTEPDPVEVVLPSAAGMEHVAYDAIEVGSPDIGADTPNVLARHALEGSLDYYIEPFTITNAGFRAWIVGTAGDDADAWRRYAPADWLARAPGGAATQSTYADGTADKAVQGTSYETAGAYCASQGKRLATEVEWEVAATTGVIADLSDEAQDWVTDWEGYGPGPADTAGRQVLRGANGTLQVDPYYRVFAPEAIEATAARQAARIRCAADEVAVGGRTFPTVIFQDDFNALGWPQTKENGFELGYHPENYHLDVSNDHAQLAVVRTLEESLADGRVDVDSFVERNNTGSSTSNHNFGVVVGTADALYTLTVQPDELERTSFLACFQPVDPDLSAALELDSQSLSSGSDGRFATVGPNGGHYSEDCEDAPEAVEVPVTTVDSPVRLSVVLTDGHLEAWVNEVLVATSSDLNSIDVYGFKAQNYARQRSHTHFDRVTISGT